MARADATIPTYDTMERFMHSQGGPCGHRRYAADEHSHPVAGPPLHHQGRGTHQPTVADLVRGGTRRVQLVRGEGRDVSS